MRGGPPRPCRGPHHLAGQRGPLRSPPSPNPQLPPGPPPFTRLRGGRRPCPWTSRTRKKRWRSWRARRLSPFRAPGTFSYKALLRTAGSAPGQLADARLAPARGVRKDVGYVRTESPLITCIFFFFNLPVGKRLPSEQRDRNEKAPTQERRMRRKGGDRRLKRLGEPPHALGATMRKPF